MNVMTVITKVVGSRRGQTLVELTLIFPIMLLLVLGAIEVGSVISAYLTLTHMTREGANLTSRGTVPNTALNAVIAAALPTIKEDPGGNEGQWNVIYTKIIQDPASPPCPAVPPPSCIYKIDSQIVRGGFSQMSKLGKVGDTLTSTKLPGIDTVAPNQIFHAFEAYYDYGPVSMTFVANSIDKTFYDRTIFTNVSAN